MADFFDDLEQALTDATVRRYATSSKAPDDPGSAPRRTRNGMWWLRRLWRRRPLAVVIGALVLCGSAAGAVISLASHKSAPLTGAVPSSPGLATAGFHYDISVIPDFEPDDAPGWCSYPRFSAGPKTRLARDILAAQSVGGGVCSPAYAGDPPVIIGGGENSLFWWIVSSRVAALRFGSSVIRPLTNPRLPDGWKAVVAFSRAFNPVGRPPRLIHLLTTTPLDATGRPITFAPVTRLARVPVRSIDPHHPPGGLCSLPAVHLPGVTRQWEVVATTIPRFGSAVTADALHSCARAWYQFGNAPVLSAAVLLNARDPNRRAPAPPDLRATGTPGVFSEDGGASGNIAARRLGRAWLVVQGGTPQLRASLLRSLIAGART